MFAHQYRYPCLWLLTAMQVLANKAKGILQKEPKQSSFISIINILGCVPLQYISKLTIFPFLYDSWTYSRSACFLYFHYSPTFCESLNPSRCDCGICMTKFSSKILSFFAKGLHCSHKHWRVLQSGKTKSKVMHQHLHKTTFSLVSESQHYEPCDQNLTAAIMVSFFFKMSLSICVLMPNSAAISTWFLCGFPLVNLMISYFSWYDRLVSFCSVAILQQKKFVCLKCNHRPGNSGGCWEHRS